MRRDVDYLIPLVVPTSTPIRRLQSLISGLEFSRRECQLRARAHQVQTPPPLPPTTKPIESAAASSAILADDPARCAPMISRAVEIVDTLVVSHRFPDAEPAQLRSEYRHVTLRWWKARTPQRCASSSRAGIAHPHRHTLHHLESSCRCRSAPAAAGTAAPVAEAGLQPCRVTRPAPPNRSAVTVPAVRCSCALSCTSLSWPPPAPLERSTMVMTPPGR